MKFSAFRATLTALGLIGLALGAGARAQDGPGDWQVSRLTHASRIPQGFAHLIRPLALRHRRSEAAMRELLSRERDLWLDSRARLLYRCEAPAPAAGAERSAAEREAFAAPPYPLESTFQLHSRPTSGRKIYLDFDGHTTSGTWWNEDTGGSPIVSAPFNTDGNSASFGAAELEAIQLCWQRVAEDYAPFDVDVTTEDPGVDGLRRTSNSDQNFGVRVVISPTDAWFGKSGGVAYISVFSMVNTGNDLPAFVFTSNLSNSEKNIAEAAAHEAGHTLGLSHDGAPGTEYYKGRDDSNWAPIMGTGYYKPITQWSKGEYTGATQKQDDFLLMQQNGVPFCADDHGNTRATATLLSGSSPAVTGLIEQRTDVDFFQFTTGAGSITLAANPAPRGPNLDLRLDLYDANGVLLAFSDPAGQAASLTRSVPAGTYFVSVDGVGAGDPATSGYSDYGSLGQYTLGASLVPAAGSGAALTLTAPNGGETCQSGTVQVITWSSSGVSGNVRLELTTDGNVWTPISSSTQNDGSESWTVPNVTTSQARIRVSSVNDAAIVDTSDAPFTIAQPGAASITLTSPNGGESWPAGSVRTLTWSSSNVSATVRLDYSRDGGSTWTAVASSTANDGAENWVVPNQPTASALLRVSATDNSVSDVSNGVFSITAAGDSHEVDDDAATAKTLEPRQTQSRSIHAAGNADWVKIVLTSRLRTVLATKGVAGGDTVLSLYAADGVTLLASNDDQNKKTKYSRVAARLDPGTYYARVEGKNGSTISSYTLGLTAKR